MDERLARTVDVLAAFVNDAGDLEETLTELVELGVTAIGADMGGLTIRDQHGKPTTAAYTERMVLPLDHVQYDNGRGPCLDAARTHTIFRVDDTSTDSRWPEYAATAASHGVCSSLSVPLVVGDDSLGALNIYHRSMAFFEHDHVRAAEVVAAICSIAAQHWTVANDASTIAAAMASRATIEQAKGVIMATTGCGPGEAFALLRDQSQSENRKLRDIAIEVVARQKR